MTEREVALSSICGSAHERAATTFLGGEKRANSRASCVSFYFLSSPFHYHLCFVDEPCGGSDGSRAGVSDCGQDCGQDSKQPQNLQEKSSGGWLQTPARAF